MYDEGTRSFELGKEEQLAHAHVRSIAPMCPLCPLCPLW